MIDVNSIKSRLGSISNKAMVKLPAGVRKLLLIDMIDLIQHYERTMEEKSGNTGTREQKTGVASAKQQRGVDGAQSH